MLFHEKEKYDFSDLVLIMKLLRSPDGCPWDREQDHKSIRQNFIEETYEAIEAIDTDDAELLKEELGDVLLQVVFHCEMESEKGVFNVDDVCDGICKKLVVRHPHVFGTVVADDSEQVLKNWDSIKMQTKAQTSQADAMDSVSKALPSLMRSSKLQQKAAKVGFDFCNASDALDKVREETAELEQAITSGDQAAVSEELGDLLFSAVNVARLSKVDSEKALYDACDKFAARFRKMEELARQRCIDMNTAQISELDSLWDEVK